jgi:hypothetical protein
MRETKKTSRLSIDEFKLYCDSTAKVTGFR